MAELEQFRAVFLRFIGVKPEIPQRTTVVLFATDSDFTPYKPLYLGKPKNIAGYFNGTSIYGFMALAMEGNPGAAKSVIFHEYVHSLYHEIDWVPPLWFNEGSAEVFSTFEVRRGTAYLGRSPAAHVALLQQVRLMPLPTLFAVNQQSSAYNAGLPQGIFYAQSWALAHFLICNRDQAWRQRLNSYVASMNSGAPPDIATFEAVMGVSAAVMKNKLEDHVSGGGYVVFKEPFDEAVAAAKIASRKATSAERDCVLGVLRITSQNLPDAAYHLIKLQEQFPTAALPHEARAMLAWQNDDKQRGKEELLRAAELGTTNIRTYWFMASQLVESWLNTGISPDKRIGEETARQLRELLHHTLASCPDAIEAWEALARTEAFAPTPEKKTLDELEQQASRWPKDQQSVQILMLTGFARKRLGDLTAARRLAELVEASPNAAASTQRLNRVLNGELLPEATTSP